jgi:hypothetical protein
MTQWGELDYLIFDTPPGTGDIAISLGQEIKYTAAVIVTTPQRLAYIDVIKGIEMWDELKVPTVSVVENMAYLQETDTDIKQFIFGRGHVNNLKENFGIKNSFEVPIRSAISKYSDLGTRPLPKVPPSSWLFPRRTLSPRSSGPWQKTSTKNAMPSKREEIKYPMCDMRLDLLMLLSGSR